MDTIGERLKAALKHAKMTQSRLADELGVDQSNISRYVRNETKPKKGLIYTIAIFLNVNPEWLINGIGNLDDPVNLKTHRPRKFHDKRLDFVNEKLYDLKEAVNSLHYFNEEEGEDIKLLKANLEDIHTTANMLVNFISSENE